jgi:hypothetical protein
MSIKPPIATLQKAETLVSQGSLFLQIGHSAV